MKRKPITPDPESVMQSLREVGLELIPCPEHPDGLTVVDENGNEIILPPNFNIFDYPSYRKPEKENKTMIIVKVRHSENGQEFIFRTPTHLVAGTQVLVETKRGRQTGTVSSDSIEVSKEQFDYIASSYHNGGAPELRNVIGRYILTEFLTTSEQ